MKKILKFLRLNKNPEVIGLNEADREKLSTLSSRRFTDLSHKDQREILEIGAKDFSQKFSEVIKELSRE